MSSRLGSTINSELFMSDPITRSGIRKQEYFVKGEEDTEIWTKDESTEDDTLIINSEGGSFNLHRKTLKDTLIKLKEDSHLSIKDLSPENTESFRSIVETLRLLYNSQELYDLVLKDVYDIFSNVKNVRPGTVAAFFIGCFDGDKFSGPMGCGPKCAASLPPSEGTPGYSNCDDLVLIYKDDIFSSLNDTRSQHAYIYIEDNNFQGFNSNSISELKNAGIQKCSLVFGNQDGSYREVTSSTNVEDLPKIKQVNQTEPTQNNASNAGAAVFIIIIVIVVLLLVVLLNRYIQ